MWQAEGGGGGGGGGELMVQLWPCIHCRNHWGWDWWGEGTSFSSMCVHAYTNLVSGVAVSHQGCSCCQRCMALLLLPLLLGVGRSCIVQYCHAANSTEVLTGRGRSWCNSDQQWTNAHLCHRTLAIMTTVMLMMMMQKPRATGPQINLEIQLATRGACWTWANRGKSLSYELDGVMIVPKRILSDLENDPQMKDHGACFEIMIWPWRNSKVKIKTKIMTCLRY